MLFIRLVTFIILDSFHETAVNSRLKNINFEANNKPTMRMKMYMLEFQYKYRQSLEMFELYRRVTP